MDQHVMNVVEECTRASDEERASFPQVVGRLMEVGIERYDADLVRSEKTYYLPNGDSAVICAHRPQAEAAREFSAAAVEAAVRAIQARNIGYREFCERVLAAGCIGYTVSLVGRRAVYFGRTAESYAELFPQRN
jgi:uncharacterized protein YbcV (DUF1398 family)